MTVLPNKLIIQTILKTYSHQCNTNSAGDYMVYTYISLKLTLFSDLFFSLSFSTSGTVSIGTVLSMLFVRYLVLLHPSSNIRLLLKPNLYLQWFTLQTNQNEFRIDWWLTHNKGGYILWPSKVGLVTTGLLRVIFLKSRWNQPTTVKSIGNKIIPERCDHHKITKDLELRSRLCKIDISA